MLKPWIVAERRATSEESPDQMQIPWLGNQQGKNKNEDTSPNKQTKKQELHDLQAKTELHSGAILQRAGWKPQKNLPKIWNTSVLQRR